MGMLDITYSEITEKMVVSEEEGISLSETVGMEIEKAFNNVSDKIAEKTWIIYDSKTHNRCVCNDYGAFGGPPCQLDRMKIRSVKEYPDKIRVYAV